MSMLKRTVVGALVAGVLVVLVAGPMEVAAQDVSGHATVPVASCHDTMGGPGGGCPLAGHGE
jgi:hypothetical protein